MRRSNHILFGIVGTMLLIGWVGTLPAEEVDFETRLLEKYGVAADAEGVSRLLRWVQGDDLEAGAVQQLIADLGHADFQTREAATASLAALGNLPKKWLDQAKQSPDFEVATRARRVGEKRVGFEQDRVRLISAALRLVSSKQLSVPTSVLRKTPPHLEGERQTNDWIAAITSRVASEDTAWMQAALNGDDTLLRLAAIRGLPRADPGVAIELLGPLVEHKDLAVAFPASLGLAELGDRTPWPRWLAWAASNDEGRRVRGVQLLRATSGKNFRLNAFEDPGTQTELLAAWGNWIKAQGELAADVATYRFQGLALPALSEEIPRGLIAHYTMDKMEGARFLDQSGNKRDGSVHGNTKLVDGIIGRALRLQGQGTVGTNGGHADLPFIDFNRLEAFTLAMWVRQEGQTYNHGEAFICYGFDQGSTYDGSLCVGSFHGSIQFRAGLGMVTIPQPDSDRGRWVHYAMSYAKGRLSVFKDGEFVADRDQTVAVKGDKAALGRHWWSNGAETSTRFIGALDDIRVYNRALGDAQLKTLFAYRGAID